MIVKHMIGAKARCRKTYTFPPMTPIEGESRMRSREEIQQVAIARAREFADRRGFRGGGYMLEDYQKSLSELSPEERELERGLQVDGDDGDGQVEPTQRERAGRHYAERIRHYVKQGHTYARATELAKAEERRSGLHVTRAGVPKGSIWAAAAAQNAQEHGERFARMTGQQPGAGTLKTHAARVGPLSTIENEKLSTARPTLVRQVAADCLHRGRTQPDHHSWRWVDAWFGANVPPPPPTSGTDGTAALAGYTAAREAFLDEVIEAARVILRDPQAANLLRPAPLGS